MSESTDVVLSGEGFSEEKESHPWDMQPGETVRSYGAFLDFRDMGSGRKLTTLHKHYQNLTSYDKSPSARASSDLPREPPTLSYQVLRDWSMKHKWHDRIAAWEQWEAGRSADLWAQRRAEKREADWEDGQMLREGAREILRKIPDHRVVRTKFIKGKRQQIVGKDGKLYEIQLEPDREIITRDVNTETALKAMSTGEELQGQAIGESGDGGAERLTIREVTYERISKEELHAIQETLVALEREKGKS